MLLAKIISDNKMLREVNTGYDYLLDIERARSRKLTRDLETLTAKLIQAQGLLDDKSSIVRHESDYNEGVTA